jgi:hypothetical protein
MTPGHADVTRSVTLNAGASTSLTIDAQSGASDAPAPVAAAEPPPVVAAPKGSPLRTLAYVAGGVGVVGIATFSLFGVMAHSSYNELQSTCGTAPCPASKADEISSGKTKQTIANVGLAVGIVGLAAGTTFFVISLKKHSASPGAALLVSPTWVGVGGRL